MTATARKVPLMSKDVEARVIAKMEAVSGELTRSQIFDRFDDDFADEEDCAKCLGRLVADGRLVRRERERNGRSEFVYATPGNTRVEVIAAAAARTAPKREPAPTPPAPKAAEPQTAAPQHGRHANHQVSAILLEHLTPERGWLAPRDIGAELGLAVNTLRHHLARLVDQGVIQARGATSGRRYAAVGTRSDAAPLRPLKRGSAKRDLNLGELGAEPMRPPHAPQLPARIPEPAVDLCDEPRCAIEDTGLFAISDGCGTTIRLTQRAIAKVVRFLELTQHVWKQP